MSSILSHAIERGFDPIIALELPKSCQFWDTPKMSEFLLRFGMRTAHVDGCAYGIVAQFGNYSGQPIKKLWTIAAGNPVFLGAFPRKCKCPT